MSRYAIENLFGIEGFNVAWYGVIIAIALLAGVWLATYRAKKDGICSDLIYDFIIVALPASILAARIYYVVFRWQDYSVQPEKIFAVWEGGLAIYGGVLGGLLAAVIFCKRNRFPFWRFVDIVAPCLVLGQSIGRWGNFVNQEAYGRVVGKASLQFFPYAVYIEADGQWHQATFFYESLWNSCILVVMLLFVAKIKRSGVMLPAYFIGYGTGRFFIEGLRSDSLYLFPGIRISQVLSLVLVLTGAVLWFFVIRKNTETISYKGKYLMTDT